MKQVTLALVEPERDIAEIAALFSLEQDEPTLEPGLREDYEEHKERIFRLMVAEDEVGKLLRLIGPRAAGSILMMPIFT